MLSLSLSPRSATSIGSSLGAVAIAPWYAGPRQADWGYAIGPIATLGIGYSNPVSDGKESVGVDEARREIAGGDATAFDVRSEEEWSEGHIPGAIHLPDGDPEAATKPLRDGARLMVIAKDGRAAEQAAEALRDDGYDAVAVDGGMDDWASEDFKIQPTADPDEDTELGLS
jgi:rhodanese-related sulfurtransferase